MAIANKYDLPVLEDAAEALGSTYYGVKCRVLGDLGVLSFNGNKIITTSGGGALVTKDRKQKEKAVFYATQARDDAPHYQRTQIGYNYRMSNIVAGIGRGQMVVIDDRVNARRENYEFYVKELGNLTGFKFLLKPEGFFSNRWLSTVLIDKNKTGVSTNQLREALEKINIETRPLWKPMHQQPIFKDNAYYGGTVAEDLFHTGLCLPSGSNQKNSDLKYVVDNIKKIVKG